MRKGRRKEQYTRELWGNFGRHQRPSWNAKRRRKRIRRKKYSKR